MEDLPLFPLNTVLFPSMPLTLHIFEERYKQMIAHCLEGDRTFGVLLIREGSEVGAPAVPFEIGTTAQIIGVERLLEGRMNLVAMGRKRFRLLEITQKRPYLVGRVEHAPHVLGERIGMLNAAVSVRKSFGEYLDLVAGIIEAELKIADLPADAASLAYTVAAALQVDKIVKQGLLASDSVKALLENEAQILPRETARLRLLTAVEQERKKMNDSKIGSFSKN